MSIIPLPWRRTTVATPTPTDPSSIRHDRLPVDPARTEAALIRRLEIPGQPSTRHLTADQLVDLDRAHNWGAA